MLKNVTTAGKNMKINSGGLVSVMVFKGLMSYQWEWKSDVWFVLLQWSAPPESSPPPSLQTSWSVFVKLQSYVWPDRSQNGSHALLPPEIRSHLSRQSTPARGGLCCQSGPTCTSLCRQLPLNTARTCQPPTSLASSAALVSTDVAVSREEQPLCIKKIPTRF